jgi:hypothetical protein
MAAGLERGRRALRRFRDDQDAAGLRRGAADCRSIDIRQIPIDGHHPRASALDELHRIDRGVRPESRERIVGVSVDIPWTRHDEEYGTRVHRKRHGHAGDR